MNSLIRPAKLVAAQAAIDAATEQYLQSGGTITRLDNKGSPVEHLSWKEEADRTKAAGLSYMSERGHLVLREKPKPDPAAAHEGLKKSIKRARESRSSINAARRAKLAPEVRALAKQDYPVTQIGRELGIAPGTVRRIGKDHGIQLNTSMGAMPVRGTV